jgi:NCAIR mutase (PurE)-related protein
MNTESLRQLLRKFKQNKLTEDALLQKLATLPYESLGFATIDHHRELRQGFPEVILCEGKTPDQVAAIAKKIVEHGHRLLATRATRRHFQTVKKNIRTARYNPIARTITVGLSAQKREKKNGKSEKYILVVSAGTSDIPIAEEAVVTAEMMGNNVKKLYDVGVAGIHRLLAHNELLRKANVIIVVAGMEGALASVVGGLVNVPVIAVPTSVGYGANFGGLSALLSMLNSCAAGVTVVNIDNGFGAGFAASLINRIGN